MINREQFIKVDRNLERAYRAELRTVVFSTSLGVVIALGAIIFGPQKMALLAAAGAFAFAFTHVCFNLQPIERQRHILGAPIRIRAKYTKINERSRALDDR